ncbi:MAG: hypothetical protein ACKVS9_10790 [Phycisphaerae bacterium]
MRPALAPRTDQNVGQASRSRLAGRRGRRIRQFCHRNGRSTLRVLTRWTNRLAKLARIRAFSTAWLRDELVEASVPSSDEFAEKTSGFRMSVGEFGDGGWEEKAAPLTGVEPVADSAQVLNSPIVTRDDENEWRTDWRMRLASDPAFAAVAEAWPMLPEALRAGIVAMVKAATPGR